MSAVNMILDFIVRRRYLFYELNIKSIFEFGTETEIRNVYMNP